MNKALSAILVLLSFSGCFFSTPKDIKILEANARQSCLSRSYYDLSKAERYSYNKPWEKITSNAAYSCTEDFDTSFGWKFYNASREIAPETISYEQDRSGNCTIRFYYNENEPLEQRAVWHPGGAGFFLGYEKYKLRHFVNDSDAQSYLYCIKSEMLVGLGLIIPILYKDSSYSIVRIPKVTSNY